MGPITSLSDIPRVLKRRIWIILLVLMIGMPLAYFHALNQPRVYEAVAVIQIEAPQVMQQVTSTTGATTGPLDTDNELDLIEQQLMSRDHIISVLESYDLFLGAGSITERVSLMRGAVEIVELIDAANAWRSDVHPSGLVIMVRLDDPVMAANVANMFLEQVLAEAQERTSGRTARTLEFLVAEETRLSDQIAELEFEFSAFQQENAGSLPAAIATQRTQLAGLQESRIEIEQQIVELQISSGQILAEALQRQSQLLTQRLDLVNGAIAEINVAVAAGPEIERQIGGYERQLTQLQDELGVITTRRAEAAMNQLLETRNQAERFEVLETAIPPEFSISASRRKIAFAGGFVVLFLALSAAVGLEMIDGRIRTPGQLEKELGVLPVIAIPNLQSNTMRRRGRLIWISGLVAAIVAGAVYLRHMSVALTERMRTVVEARRAENMPAE